MLEVSSWVSVVGLVYEFMIFDVVSELGSRKLKTFTSNNNDSLTTEKLFGYL